MAIDEILAYFEERNGHPLRSTHHLRFDDQGTFGSYRGLIVQGTTNERARRILPKLVEIIHELGAQVVCEGIENLDQHSLAIDAGADLVQGYYYARPSSDLINPLTQTDARPFHLIGGPDWPHHPLPIQTASISTRVMRP